MNAPNELAPRAIFGDLLWGDKALRFVYMDEAGTSELEPVTIVVGLIVDADKQLIFAETAVNEVLGSVPPKFRKDFIFHAADVWGNRIYRDDWSMSDRLAFLRNMMSLPRRLKIPISMGMMRRGFLWSPETQSVISKLKLSAAQWDHIMAFSACVARADKYIREHAGLQEIGSIVAEDVPEMRKFLKVAPKIFRDNPIVLPPGMVLPTLAEQKAGFISQETEQRVSRIRQSIHFVDKSDDLLLHLADACAFGFRRYFSEQEHGAMFIRAILGEEPIMQDYSGRMSHSTFWFN